MRMVSQCIVSGSRQFSGRKRTAAWIGCALILAGCGMSGALPTGYEAQIKLAERFEQNGQYRQSYELLEKVAQKHPESSQVNLSLAQAYFRSVSLLKAEAHYRNAIETGAFVEGHLGLGRVALARNESDRAIDYFKTVLVQDIGSVEAKNGLGVGYDISGQHHKAQSIYREILKQEPTNRKALNNLGLSLVLSGNAHSAVTVLTDLTESNLDSSRARQNLAIAYFLSGQKAVARELAALDMPQDEFDKLVSAIASYRRSTS